MEENIFDEFLGQEVKTPYKDGTQLKIAYGKLDAIKGNFVRIDGRLGIIIINKKNIEKMSRVKTC